MPVTLVKMVAYAKRKESFITVLSLLIYDTDIPQKNLARYVDIQLHVCVGA